MVMILDEIGRRWKKKGEARKEKMMNDDGRADDAFYEITKWSSLIGHKVHWRTDIPDKNVGPL